MSRNQTAPPPLIPGNSNLQSEVVTSLKALKLTDGTFTATSGVFTGATITNKNNNVGANSLKTTDASVDVSTSASPASGYVLIATTPTTATWQPQSALSVSSGFGMFYGLTAGTGNSTATDYAATVAVKTSVGTGRVPFPRLGAMSAANFPIAASSSSFTLPAIGTYSITFNVHTTEPGQLQLELNGTDLPYTCAANMNPTAGGHPITGTFFVRTVSINSVIAVVNAAGNAAALTITPADGDRTHANAQSLLITKIA